ncbi:MAG: hypothetical protein GWP05_01900 [Anaerolineaceae bacterium]|nr:hypothetical protein [Anaerolineaceae bacterium]
MAKQRLDKESRRIIVNARNMVAAVAKADGNEAETRRRVERIFESLLGYDAFKHISREHAVRGSGETEHCDFAIQLESGEDIKPVVLVELKRVNVDLARKHLKQVSSYAINAGCEWIVLTNGREWRLYHVAFGQPPEVTPLDSWNLLEDDPTVLWTKFQLISYRNIRKGGLDDLWAKRTVLTAKNILGAVLSEESIRLLRRRLRKATGILIKPEEVVTGVRKLLNEAAAGQLDSMKILLPARKQKRQIKKKPKVEAEPTETRVAEDATITPADDDSAL